MPTLTDAQCLALMQDLDSGSNMFGSLPARVRARIYTAASQPSQDSWDDAYSAVLTTGPEVTLWQALLEHTDYSVTSRGLGDTWPAIPTQGQILAAVHAAIAGES